MTPVTEGSASACEDANHDGAYGRGAGPAQETGYRVMTQTKNHYAVLGDRLLNYLTAAMAVLAVVTLAAS